MAERLGNSRAAVVAWVAREIIPHESAVRAWLRRSGMRPEDVDDVMQDVYCRFSGLAGVAHIANARSYFFSAARAVVIDQLRRAKVVRIETVSDIAAFDAAADEPSPEQITDARRQLNHVRRLIAALPDRCRRVFEMRKIDGLPQREIARRLGITETIVENDVMRGQRLLQKALCRAEEHEDRPVRGIAHG